MISFFWFWVEMWLRHVLDKFSIDGETRTFCEQNIILNQTHAC